MMARACRVHRRHAETICGCKLPGGQKRQATLATCRDVPDSLLVSRRQGWGRPRPALPAGTNHYTAPTGNATSFFPTAWRLCVKQYVLGLGVFLVLLAPAGCLSGGEDLVDLNDGVPVVAGAADSAADVLTGVLGDPSSDDVSKGDLLATMIEFFAATSDSSDSEALLWEVAASAARDGRAGVKRSVANFVVGQVASAVAGAAIPATP